jgi:hypothetical protein
VGGWSLTLQSLKALGGGFEGGGERRERGGYRVVKLMKQKKGGGNTLSFPSPEKDFFYICLNVMTWEKKKKTLYMTTHVTSDAPSFILHLVLLLCC